MEKVTIEIVLSGDEFFVCATLGEDDHLDSDVFQDPSEAITQAAELIKKYKAEGFSVTADIVLPA